MKTQNRQSGYSVNIAIQYINNKYPIQSLSTKLEPQQKFEDNHPTGEIIAYKGWFSQEGLPPFQVKFNSKVTLPSYLSLVEFEQLEACEIGFNVYFRAKNLKEVK